MLAKEYSNFSEAQSPVAVKGPAQRVANSHKMHEHQVHQGINPSLHILIYNLTIITML